MTAAKTIHHGASATAPERRLDVAVRGSMVGVRVIVSFVGGWGHAEPLLPVAAFARRLGHRVSFAGQAAVVGRLARMGYETDVVGPDTLRVTSTPLVPVDRAAERAVMRDHFVANFGRTRAMALGELYDRERPGLVVCDEVDVGAVVAAEQRSIRCLTVSVIAAGLLMSPAVVARTWNELRRANGLAADPSVERIGGDLVVAPMPRSLRAPSATPPPTMRFLRPPILDDVQRRDAGGGRRLVYVTLGTVFNLESGDLLDRLVHAMNVLSDKVDADVVVTTGPNIRVGDLPAPNSQVSVEAFVPQRELLGRCDAVVSHAGSGTLVAALSLGIPVVVLPMGADQPDNADRCEALGVGIALDAVAATPAAIVDATESVLHDRRFREAATAIAAEARSQPSIRSLLELNDLLSAGPGRDAP